MIRQSVWLDCEEPSCPYGTAADPRHLPNLLASGGFYCPKHDTRGDNPA